MLYVYLFTYVLIILDFVFLFRNDYYFAHPMLCDKSLGKYMHINLVYIEKLNLKFRSFRANGIPDVQ